MRAACCGTQIVYHVSAWNNAETVAHQQVSPEDGLVESFALRPVLLAHRQEIVAVTAFLNNGFQLSNRMWVIHPCVMFVPLVNDSSPRCPTPDAEVGREEVVLLYIRCLLFHVESGNHGNALIVLITIQHFLAECEERDGRYIVIFQYHTFVRLAESPLLGDNFRGVAAVVAFLLQLMHLAVPVNLTDHFPAGPYAFNIFLVAWTVLVKEESGGACFPYLRKNLLQRCGPHEE